MSLLKKIGSAFKKAAPLISQVAPAFGPIGMAVGQAAGMVAQRQAAKAAAVMEEMPAPRAPRIISQPTGVMNMSIMPNLGNLGNILRGAAGRAGAIARKYPGTVSTAGGVLGGVAGGMFGGGGGVRRRRAKGITAAELRGARKVARLVKMYGLKPKVGRSAGRRSR